MPVGKVSGQDVVCGIVPVEAWDIPHVAGAGHKLGFISEGLGSSTELEEDPSIAGGAVPLPGAPGLAQADGPMEFAFTYQGLEHIVLGCLGDYNYSSSVHSGGLKSTAAGFNFTLVLAKLIKVFEYANAKPKGITITGNPKDVRLKVDWQGNKCNKNGAAGAGIVNDLTTVASIAFPAAYGRDLVRFRDFIVLFGADPADAWLVDAAAFSPIDPDLRLCVSEFSLAVQRAQEGEQTTCTGTGKEEPDPTGFVDVTLSLTVPYYADSSQACLDLLDACESKATFGVGLYASGPDYADVITDATRFRHKFFMPCLQASVDGPNASGSGKMPLKFTCKAKALPTAIGGGVPNDPLFVSMFADNATTWTWATEP